jgi:hypothetical protein
LRNDRRADAVDDENRAYQCDGERGDCGSCDAEAEYCNKNHWNHCKQKAPIISNDHNREQHKEKHSASLGVALVQTQGTPVLGAQDEHKWAYDDHSERIGGVPVKPDLG